MWLRAPCMQMGSCGGRRVRARGRAGARAARISMHMYGRVSEERVRSSRKAVAPRTPLSMAVSVATSVGKT